MNGSAKTNPSYMKSMTEERAGKLLRAIEMACIGDQIDAALFDELDMARSDTRTNIDALYAILARIDVGALSVKSVATFDAVCNGPLL